MHLKNRKAKTMNIFKVENEYYTIFYKILLKKKRTNILKSVFWQKGLLNLLRFSIKHCTALFWVFGSSHGSCAFNSLEINMHKMATPSMEHDMSDDSRDSNRLVIDLSRTTSPSHADNSTTLDFDLQCMKPIMTSTPTKMNEVNEVSRVL